MTDQPFTEVHPAAVYWLRSLRAHDLTDAHQVILLHLATRKLDAATGTGCCSVRALADETGHGERTVKQALSLACKAGLLVRTLRGHRLGDGTVTASEWRIIYPDVPDDDAPAPLSPDEVAVLDAARDAVDPPLVLVRECECHQHCFVYAGEPVPASLMAVIRHFPAARWHRPERAWSVPVCYAERLLNRLLLAGAEVTMERVDDE
jgi:hypothetical protein